MSGGQYISNPFWPPPVHATTEVPVPSQVKLDNSTEVRVTETSPGVTSPVASPIAVPMLKKPSHPSLTLLHTLGKFFMENILPEALPIVLKIAIPALVAVL